MIVPPSSRIAFQGERGAFSEEAAVKLLGENIQLVPRPTFEAMYSSIQDGVADYIRRENVRARRQMRPVLFYAAGRQDHQWIPPELRGDLRLREVDEMAARQHGCSRGLSHVLA